MVVSGGLLVVYKCVKLLKNKNSILIKLMISRRGSMKIPFNFLFLGFLVITSDFVLARKLLSMEERPILPPVLIRLAKCVENADVNALIDKKKIQDCSLMHRAVQHAACLIEAHERVQANASIKKALELLIQNGINPNTVRTVGNNGLLHAAVMYNIRNTELIQMLIDAGVDPHQQNNHGSSPIDKVSNDLVKMLLEAGVDPNHQNRQEVTPLDGITHSNDRHFISVPREYEPLDREQRRKACLSSTQRPFQRSKDRPESEKEPENKKRKQKSKKASAERRVRIRAQVQPLPAPEGQSATPVTSELSKMAIGFILQNKMDVGYISPAFK